MWPSKSQDRERLEVFAEGSKYFLKFFKSAYGSGAEKRVKRCYFSNSQFSKSQLEKEIYVIVTFEI